MPENLFTQNNVTDDVPFLSLKLVRESTATYRKKEWTVTDPSSLARVFERAFRLSESPEETLCMITLNTRHQPLGFWRVSTGSLNESIVHPREVFKRALLTNAHAIVLAHNHPSGNPSFSPQDKKCAGRLETVGNTMGIRLLDFLVIGTPKRYLSAAEKGIINPSRPAQQPSTLQEA